MNAWLADEDSEKPMSDQIDRILRERPHLWRSKEALGACGVLKRGLSHGRKSCTFRNVRACSNWHGEEVSVSFVMVSKLC